MNLKANFSMDPKPAKTLTADRSAAVTLHTALADALELLAKVERGDEIGIHDFRKRIKALKLAHGVGAQLLYSIRFNDGGDKR